MTEKNHLFLQNCVKNIPLYLVILTGEKIWDSSLAKKANGREKWKFTFSYGFYGRSLSQMGGKSCQRTGRKENKVPKIMPYYMLCYLEEGYGTRHQPKCFMRGKRKPKLFATSFMEEVCHKWEEKKCQTNGRKVGRVPSFWGISPR